MTDNGKALKQESAEFADVSHEASRKWWAVEMLGHHEKVPMWRLLLDVVATVAIVLSCGVLLWRLLFSVGDTARERRDSATVPTQPVDLDGAQLKGSDRAPVVVIEYSEFQCPFCGAFSRDTLPAIDREYIQAGTVQLAFVHFPLEQIHPLAVSAAEAAECAGLQGKFWQMHDVLFGSPTALSSLDATIDRLGLDGAQFDACRAADTESRIRDAAARAMSLGVSSTPTFFFGTRAPDGHVRVLKRFSGARPLAEFRAAIEPLLAGP